MGFFHGVLPLGFDITFPRAKARTALLAAQEFTFSATRSLGGTATVLDFVEQQLAGDEAVHALLPRVLALYLNASGPVYEHDAGGNLVHVLSTVTAGADEGFLNVRFTHAERSHALR